MNRHTKVFMCIAIALAAISSGCTHTKMLYRADLANEIRSSKNTTGAIVLNSGEHFNIRSIDVHGDSVSWNVEESESAATAHNRDIYEIRLNSRGKGFADGMGIGGLIGFVTGLSIGFSSGGDEWLGASSADFAAAGAMFFGFTGSILGGIVGAAKGSVNNHILTDDPPKKKESPPQQEIDFGYNDTE